CGAPLAQPGPAGEPGRVAAARGRYDLARFLGIEGEPAKRPKVERKKLTQDDIRHLLREARPREP
ncbi:MAG: hypothetical protein ACUVYA_18805, partial [Planctomycetota bacterium]